MACVEESSVSEICLNSLEESVSKWIMVIWLIELFSFFKSF